MMSTATQDNVIEEVPERQKQHGYVEGFFDYRVFGIEKKLDDVTDDIRDLRTHIYNLDSRLNTKIDQLDSKLNSRMDKFDARMDKFDARIDKIDDRLWVLLLGVALSILIPILLRFL